ncbi:hypothetical protein R3P38DRAFT_3170894 [Favolaschia claudopus]|uniref:Uncharacterized protein n=1 Tax=Favolaschia claudopus TaxID=2862362 RepID=A0AAW0DLT2_9AGAR
MTNFNNPTTAGAERSAAAAAYNNADLASAFQAVLNALASYDLSRADANTVNAFQTVLDTLASVNQARSEALRTEALGSSVYSLSSVTESSLGSSVAGSPRSRSPPSFGFAAGATPGLFGAAPIFPAPNQNIDTPAISNNPALSTTPPYLSTTAPWVAGTLYIVVPPQRLAAIPEPGGEDRRWYSIYKGKFVGVTASNGLALAATVGVSGGQMSSWKTQALALAAFNEAIDFHTVAVVV